MVQNRGLTQKSFKERIMLWISHNWRLHLLVLPGLVWLIVFCYVPMYGATIAFKQYNPRLGIVGSKWVGFKHFEQFLSTSFALLTMQNTLILSLESLVFSFPVPIIFSLLLNSLDGRYFKKTVQTCSFAPHFISVVVLVSMINIFLQPDGGFLSNIIQYFNHGEIVLITARPQYFRMLYIVSGIWQSMGYNAIIYIAALTAVPIELHEAAVVDGANKIQRIIHIDIPTIIPIMVTMLILSMGKVMSVGYEKVYLMQNPMNTSVSEVLSTYVYKMGLQKAQYSFSAAVGLFNSVVNLILLVIFNFISKRVAHTSIF